GSLIHMYSTAYMHEERDSEYARYFSYLNLFAAFMLVLVLGANFLVLFVGWEGVGLCSYLLIGFWFEKKSASEAGMKAFIVNRIGDAGFALGMFLVFTTFGTLDFRTVMERAGAMPVEWAWGGTLTLIALGLFLGSGSVIHAMSGEQDMRHMGGLGDKLPWTRRTMLVGCLAIAGVTFLAGFFSKDEILWSAYKIGGYGTYVWGMGLVVAAMTA